MHQVQQVSQIRKEAVVVLRKDATSSAEDVDEGWSLFAGDVLHWLRGWEACVRPVAVGGAQAAAVVTSLGPVCESGCGCVCLCFRTVAVAAVAAGSGNGTVGVATTYRPVGVYVGDRKKAGALLTWTLLGVVAVDLLRRCCIAARRA